jgi:hypothetical protein
MVGMGVWNAAVARRNLLSHPLDGILRIYRGDSLLLSLSLPLQEHVPRRPALLTRAQKRKTPFRLACRTSPTALPSRPFLKTLRGVTESRCS